MKIAITGGTGLLGTSIVELLKKQKIEYLILSRQKHSATDNILTTDYSVKQLLSIFENVDVIFHLAASRGPKNFIEEYHSDEIITQNIYEAAIKTNVKKVVYASTISVYSDQEKLPWSERQSVQPVSLYGISKLSCEMIGNYYAKKYNLQVVNLRLAHLFGPNEKNNYMINLFMRKAYHKMTLELHKTSHAKREFLYVKDAARAFVHTIEHNETGTYNIGNSNSRLTNLEVAQKINEVFLNQGNLLIVNPSENDSLESSYMDLKNTENSINFMPMYRFENALQEIKESMEEAISVPIIY